MELQVERFTTSDFVKYPFLKDTSGYMRNSNLEYMKGTALDIDELIGTEEGRRILERAEERIACALEFISTGEKIDRDLEIPSFAVAIMLAIATKNSFIKKRYALAESKQAFSNFQGESTSRFLAIARDFGWDIAQNDDNTLPVNFFTLSMTDYLRNITHLREDKWKLTNRLLSKGKIFLNQQDASRLLEEEVQKRIVALLDAKDVPQFPKLIEDISERLVALAKEKIGESEMEGFPKEVLQSAFPPCIEVLYQAATHGKHLGHVERFTLVSFLVTIGMSTEKVAEVFKTFSDYNARLTLYQVEHIAGSKGSGTKYTPPSCSTLQTHGVCTNTDVLCGRVHHPLNYYLRKNRTVQTSLPASTAPQKP